MVSRDASTLTRAYGRLFRMGYRPHHADRSLRTASVPRLTEFQSGTYHYHWQDMTRAPVTLRCVHPSSHCFGAQH